MFIYLFMLIHVFLSKVFLLQGPPGTGKSLTIVALVHQILCVSLWFLLKSYFLKTNNTSLMSTKLLPELIYFQHINKFFLFGSLEEMKAKSCVPKPGFNLLVIYSIYTGVNY